MHVVVNKRGSRIGIRNGMFVIKHQEGEACFPIHEVKSISVHKAVSITSDSLMEALDKNIDVLLLSRSGKPLGRLWNSRYGNDSSLRNKQLAFQSSPSGMEWCKQLVVQKLENQETVAMSLYQLDAGLEREVDQCLKKINDLKTKIKLLDPQANKKQLLASLRGFEGNASKHYFQLISSHLPESYRFNKRSQHPAHDRFNACINYGYGMLYGVLEGGLLKAGLDPFSGVLHEPSIGKPVLTYDVIEIFRHWVDYVVFHLCRQEVLDPSFFSYENGCRLETDGKRILVQSLYDYLGETVEWESFVRSRYVHMEQYCYRLAKLISDMP